jgi:hypothetical protein
MTLRQIVLEQSNYERGSTFREVEFRDDGSVAILGQDLGGAPQDFWGCREYEFARHVAAADVPALRQALGVSAGGDLLAAIAERFTRSADLEAFIKEHGIPSEFWSRIGD